MNRVRTGLPFSAVAAAIAVLGVVFFGSIVLAYYRWVHHDRYAAHHLPSDSVAAIRIDVSQAVLYEPVRKHLFPVAADLLASASDGASIEAFEARTGIKRADLREIVFGRGPAPADWVLVLGGLFPDAVLASLGDFLMVGDGSSWKRGPGGRLLHASGIAIGQADDGCLIVAASEGRLALAVPSQRTYARMGLGLDGPGGFTLNPVAMKQLTRALDRTTPAGLTALGEVERAGGRLEVGTDAEWRLTLVPVAGRSAESLRGGIEQALRALQRTSAGTPGLDFAGERAMLPRARVTATEEGTVRISLAWKRGEMDRAAESVARELERWAGRAGLRGPS